MSRQDIQLKKRRVVRLVPLVTICLAVAIAIGGAASGDDPSSPPQRIPVEGVGDTDAASGGLIGILPEETPAGLTEDDFLQLGGKWEDWATEAAEEVADLYLNEELDVNGQRELIQKLRRRTLVMERALRDDRYKPIHKELAGLHGRLARRLDLADAILDTPGLGISPDPKSREIAAELLVALDAHEQYMLNEDAAGIRKLMNDLAASLPDHGARLEPVLVSHYFNYNFELIVAEPIIKYVMSDRRQETEPVNDMDESSGARITGSQTTTAVVDVDLKPGEDRANLVVGLKGTVVARTHASTDVATVHLDGRFSFAGSKPVNFDGFVFRTGPGRVNADGVLRLLGANTKYDGTCLEGYARRKAMYEARKKLPEAQQSAIEDVKETAETEFNDGVDEQLAEANMQIETDYRPRLANAGLTPSIERIRSSEHHLRYSSRSWAPTGLAGDRISTGFYPKNGFVLSMHESLLNHMFDQMNFAGRTMTEAEIRQELESYFSDLLDRQIDLSSSNGNGAPAGGKEEGLFIFDDHDPVRFRIDDGRVNVILRTGFQREGENDIPTKIVTVPLSYKFEGDEIVIERGDVIVAPIGRQPGHIAQAGVLRKRIQESIGTRRESRNFVFPVEGKDDLDMKVHDLKSVNGWLTMWAE